MDDDEGPISNGETDQTTLPLDDRYSNASPKSSVAMKRKHDDEETSSSSISMATANNTVSNVAVATTKSTLCGECGTVIQNSSNLVVHMRRHLQYKPHHCSQCDYQGYDADDVRRHASRNHSGQNWKVNHRSKIDMEALVRDMVNKCKTVGIAEDEVVPVDVIQKSTSPDNCSAVSSSASSTTDATDLNQQIHKPIVDAASFGSKSSIFGLQNSTAGTLANANQFILGPRGPDVLSGLLYAALSQMDLDSMKCGLCGESIPHNPVPIIRHLKIHSQFGGYACAFCESHSKTVSDLELHLLNVHSDNLDDEKMQPILNSARKSMRQEMTQLVETAFWGLGQMAKIKCSLCNEKILWRSSSLYAHLKEHVGYYPYKCMICTMPFVDHSALMEHFTMQHSGTFPVLNYVADLKSKHEIDDMFDKCFPALSASFIEELEPESRKQRVQVDTSYQQDGDFESPIDNPLTIDDDEDQTEKDDGGPEFLDKNANSTKTTVSCNLCQAKISRNMSCLIAHAKVHLAYKPLKCEYCNFRHFAMSKIRRHNARVHNNKPVKVSYHPVPDIGKQIKDMKVKCFGLIAGPSAANQYAEQTEMMDDGDSSDDNGPIMNGVSALPVDSGLGRLDQSTPMVTVADLLKGLISGAVNPMSSLGSASPVFVSPNSKSLKSENEIAYDSSGMGKKMCKMCNTYIANNPSSFENHACKHLDYKPYNCHYCQYQSYIRGKVTRHIQQVHSGFAVKIIHKPLPGIKDQIQRMKLQCFPFLSGTLEVGGLTLEAMGAALTDTNDGGNIFRSRPSVIICKLCNNQVPTDRVSMSEHVQAHIMSKYYHCPVCTYQTTHDVRAKQHMQSAHPQNSQQKILVCPADGLQGLQALRLSCFGASSVYHGLKANLFGAGSDMDGKNIFENMKQDDSDDETSTGGNKEVLEDDDSDDVPLPVSTGNEEIIEYADEAPMEDDGKVQCVLCSEIIINQQIPMNLHARKHIDYKPYQCSYCNWKSISETDVKHHILTTHRNAPPKVIYHPERIFLAKVQQKCFPTVSLITVMNGESSRGHSPASNVISSVAQGHGLMNAPLSTSNNLLRRLVCKLCSGTIADNPKSVGIHVKNHLNYKPYRCPYCRYMSCEQSKARRHVEHVHTVNGDAIEIHAEENIKEKISEMKTRCFPNLGQMGLSDVYGSGSGTETESMAPPAATTMRGPRVKSQLETYKEDSNLAPSADDDETSDQTIFQCGICKEQIPVESTDHHVRTHLGKPYKCAYCTSQFWTDEKVKQHIQSIHPFSAPKFVFQGGDLDMQFGLMKKRCFPELSSDEGFVEPEDDEVDHLPVQLSSRISSQQSNQNRNRNQHSSATLNSSRKMVTPVDGRLGCLVCDQWVSMNPNSLDVHVKNHLEFKPHSCAYCSYKSCIAGKVKRHLDSVHRGKEPKVLSFSQTSQNLKQIIADMRTACFPMMEGDVQSRSRLHMSQHVEQLRLRMTKELKFLAGESANSEDSLLSRTNDPVIDAEETTSRTLNNADSSFFSMFDGEEDEMSGLENGTFNGGKLNCAICSAQIADNPSSLGLHVRNHLDYKPFHCNLCEYKSCIQAKVKRHLRNVHKCPLDQMSYNPLPDIRVKVTEMKLKCFPRMAEAAELALVGKSSANNSDNNELSFGLDEDCVDSDGEFEVDENKLKDSWQKSQQLLNTILSDKHSLTADASAFINADDNDDEEPSLTSETANGLVANVEEIECQICGERVSNDHLSKTKHLTKHLGDFEYRCQYCDYASFVQHETLKHLAISHQGQPIRVTRVNTSGKQISAAYERLTEQCFPPFGSSSSSDDKLSNGNLASHDALLPQTIVCALCDKTITTNDDSVLDTHVFEHKNRVHYKCPHCSFAHCQNGVVKEHCRTEHPDLSMKIMTMGADTKGDEAVWMAKCFPTKIKGASTVGSVIQDFDGSDDLEDMDEDEEEMIEEGIPYKKKAHARNMSSDGPRYVCQICKSPVSMYASSLYVHVKNHMNYKPYCCGHCDYKSPVKSKVRRHIQNQHKNTEEIINYFPTPGIDHEVLRWKKKCFPEVTSFATLANDKVPCLLCKTDVADTLLSKSVHSKNHLDAKPYHCGYCSYKSCLRGETRRHVVRQHAGEAVKIEFIDSEVAAKDDVDDMIERCFMTGEPVPESVSTAPAPSPSSPSKQNRSSKTSAASSVKSAPQPVELPVLEKSSIEVKEEETDESKSEKASSSFIPAEVKSERRKNSKQSGNTPSLSRTGTNTFNVSTSGYNLRTTRSSTIGVKNSTRSHSTSGEKSKDADNSVKLGQAYREWYCCYCSFKAHSKYVVKQHCLTEHPGKAVEVSDQNRVTKKL